MLAAGILMLGVISRLIIHLPNFTPVIALALFGGVYLKKQQAVILPVLMMVIADLFLGADHHQNRQDKIGRASCRERV